jgi:hypothetical protein
MNKKTIIYSAIGLGLVIAAGFLIKVPVNSASLGSWAANWIAKHPASQAPATGQVSVPLIVKLLSKNVT